MTRVMDGGKREEAPAALEHIRTETMEKLGRLPDNLRVLTTSGDPYRVELSGSLTGLERQMRSDQHPKEVRDG